MKGKSSKSNSTALRAPKGISSAIFTRVILSISSIMPLCQFIYMSFPMVKLQPEVGPSFLAYLASWQG